MSRICLLDLIDSSLFIRMALCCDQYFLFLSNIIRRHCKKINCYSDRTQLHLSIKPDDRKYRHVFKTGLACNFLLLNLDKPEVIVFCAKNVKNVLFNLVHWSAHMCVNGHIKHICRTALCHLHNIYKYPRKKIRNVLSCISLCWGWSIVIHY